MAIRTKETVDDLRVGVATWLARVTGDETATVVELEVPEGGRSNETAYCRVRYRDASGAQERRLVVRLQPVADGLYPRTDVLEQHAVLSWLGDQELVPVPAVPWAPSGGEGIVAPFFAMSYVDGRVPADVPSYHAAGWVADLSPAERQRWAEGSIRTLAAVHEVPATSVPGCLERPGAGTALDRHIRWMEDWHRWAARDRDLELLDLSLDALLGQRPDSDESVLVWNDARPGNMIFGPDLGVSAIVDFEAAGLGPREIDLGWWLMFEQFLTTAQGVPPLAGLPDRAETISLYESASGHQAHDLGWYELLATHAFALIMLRFADREIDAGRLAPDSTMGTNNPVAQMLAVRLGRPVPDLAPEFGAVAGRSTTVEQ